MPLAGSQTGRGRAAEPRNKDIVLLCRTARSRGIQGHLSGRKSRPLMAFHCLMVFNRERCVSGSGALPTSHMTLA